MRFILIMLIAPLFSYGDNLAPSASQSMQFQEATPKRGPASLNPTSEPLPFTEINDVDTEAGFGITCSSGCSMRSPSLVTQGRDILQHVRSQGE